MNVKRPAELRIIWVVLLFVSISATSAGAVEVDVERLTLREAEGLLSERNRELRAAERAVEGAAADIISASARPNPSLSVSSTSISPGHIGSGSLGSKTIDTVVGVAQLIERGNKVELRTEVAQATANAVRSDRDDTARSQRAALRAAYFDLLQAQERLRVMTETARLFQSSLTAMNRRLKAGDVAAMDVSRLRVDALRAGNDERAARADLAKARTSLAYIIGAEANAERLVAVDAWPTLEDVPSEARVAERIEDRPDVRAAMARTSGAERSASLARSLRTRDVTVGAQIERYPGTVPTNSVGVTVSIPLFTRYYYDGEIRRAEVDKDAAQDMLARTRAMAMTEAGKARADLLSARDRLVRFNDELIAAAEKAAQGAEFAYSKGAIGVMDLLDARRQLTATRLDAIAAQADYAKALSAWRAALGLDAPAGPGTRR